MPTKGLDPEMLFSRMENAKNGDAPWRSGRSFSLVYYGGPAHSELLQKAYALFMSENGVSPRAFPSLALLERQVVGMLLDLMQAPANAGGSMTSGGTESIILAVKAYRDRALSQDPSLKRPQMVVPASAHPAYLKAAHYLGLEVAGVPVGPDFRAHPAAMSEAISERTILLAASAPSFAQGVIDPIAELGRLALERGVGLHIDACLGGFMLPFAAELGREVAPWDFSAPGVSSISADLHKYGYAAKGASAVLYGDGDLWRHQFFVDPRWSGGMYASPTMLGTRPGGIIAAAWAALMSLGRDGYLELARQSLELSERLQAAMAAMGLRVLGKPAMSVFAVASDRVDVFALADLMQERGWWLDRMNRPRSLHFIITPHHANSLEAFLDDLAACVSQAPEPLASGDDAPTVLYGMTADAAPDQDQSARLRDDLANTYAPMRGPEQDN